MEPTTLASPPAPARTDAQADAATQPAQEGAPRLDLSRMEPPRRLEEARLEEVTIDGICGVY